MLYALLVALLSLIGAALPLRFRPTHSHLQVYLSLAAGTLLGAALFHLLPEATHLVHEGFGISMGLGIVVVFLLQRYIAPHSHEASTVGEHAEHAEHRECPPVGGPHEHLHSSGPFLGGLVALLALSIHSFFDGLAIGAAAGSPAGHVGALTLSVFLSVMIHKPMDGLSVSVLLLNAGIKTRTLWLIQITYAALVPLGASIFWLTQGAVSEALHTSFVGHTLAFSAGTFCSIALTDLLPELQFHSHDRHKLSAAMIVGMGVMLVTAMIAPEHGH